MSVTAYHFWSLTCAPCKLIKPAVEDLKEDFAHVEWVSVNTHEDPENYALRFGVSVVPTIVVVAKDEFGRELSVDRHSGRSIDGYHRILRNAVKLARLS